jgi:DNA-binding transcriptional LysR family regulator
VLDDLHALVEFAQAGSIAGAADRLFRTPSAITRQLQRLEAELGAELLDRSTKPPRLNSLGSRVLERARDMLQRTEALRSLASSDAEPHGLLRIGLAHALAEGTLIEPIRALTEKYSKVQLRLLSGLTGELFNRLLAGELDVAAISGQSEDKWNLRRFSFQILTCWITEDCRESPSMRFNFTAEFC